jgi:hypothetical protein
VPILNGVADYAGLKKGTVRFLVRPWADEIKVGARSLGRAPRDPIDLVAGKYVFRVTKGDHVEKVRVEVKAGQIATVKANLLR